MTYVDASTGVLADCAMLAATVRSGAPDSVIVLDRVCATAGIDERMDAWDVDILLTGARKALSVPPGLALLFVGTRAQMFNLEPNLPNALQLGKRPRTTLSPSIAFRHGEPYMAFRTQGGDAQDQWTLNFFVAHADFGLNIQQVIDAPNFSIQPFPSSFYPHLSLPAQVTIEDRVSPAVIEELRARGHRVVVAGPSTEGYVSAVARDAGRSLLLAGANAGGMQSYAVGR